MKRLSRWTTAIMLGLASQQGIQPSIYGQTANNPAKNELQQPKKKAFGKSETSPDLPAPLASVILQEGEQPIDINNSFRLAGVQNPEIAIALQRVTEAQAVRLLAVAQLLPSINAGFNYDDHTGNLQQSAGKVISVHRQAFYTGLGANAIAAGTVNIPGLYYNLNVGDAWFSALRSQQFVAQRQAESRAVSNDILLRVALAYSELLRAEGLYAIAKKNRQDNFDTVRLTTAQFQAGNAKKSDDDRARTELRNRDIELTNAEQQIEIASAKLAQLLNLDPTTRLKPVDGYTMPTMMIPDQISLRELLIIGLANRPELAAKRAEILQAVYSLSEARLLPFSPNVILGLSAGGFGGGSNLVGSTFGSFSGRTDFDTIFYWTVSNMGVGNLAQVRIARSKLRQTELSNVEVLNRVRSEIAIASAKTHATFQKIGTAEEALNAAMRAYKEDTDKVTNGVGLPIELIDSLRLQIAARNDFLNYIIDYNRSQFELYVALGQPPANTLARPIPDKLVPTPPKTDVNIPATGPLNNPMMNPPLNPGMNPSTTAPSGPYRISRR